jgi:DNA-binding MarR family transcriptional regulator
MMTRRLTLDSFLPYLISVLASRLSAGLASVYQERFAISVAEWRVIAHLAANRNVSVREIYKRVDMGKPKVSRAAARLEKNGLIEKGAHAEDRRLVELRLSPEGKRVYAQIEPLALAFEGAVLSNLTRAEERAFRTGLTKLLNSNNTDVTSLAQGRSKFGPLI